MTQHGVRGRSGVPGWPARRCFAEGDPEASDEGFEVARTDGQAARQRGVDGRRPRGAQGSEVLREPLAQIGLELFQQAEVGEPLRVAEQQAYPLGQRAAPAKLFSVPRPDRLCLAARPQPLESRVEGGQ